MGLLVETVCMYAQLDENFIRRALDPKHNKDEVIDRLALEILNRPGAQSGNTKRYKFGIEHQYTNREKALLRIFKEVFDADPVGITAVVQQENPSLLRPYPFWKEVFHIRIPEVVSSVFNHSGVKLALTIVMVCEMWAVSWAAYSATAVLTRSWTSFIINHTPIQVVRFGNALFDLRYYVIENVVIALIYLSIANLLIEVLSFREIRIPLITSLARKIQLTYILEIATNLCFPKTILDVLVGQSWNILFLTRGTCDNFSKLLQNRVVEPAKAERLAACKDRALQAWKTIMAKGLVESAGHP